jgi:hypothetical protein
MAVQSLPPPCKTPPPVASGTGPGLSGSAGSGSSTSTTADPRAPELRGSEPDVVANVLRRDPGQPVDGVTVVELRAMPDLDPWVTRLFDSGITTTLHWQTADRTGRVGMVGEAVRLMQIADEGLRDEQQVFQGVVVVELPPGLEVARTFVEADAWCSATGGDRRRLTRFLADDGTPRFGLGVTEADVMIFEKTAAGLEMRRVENVKAGRSAGAAARHQNGLVVDHLLNPVARFLFPDNGNLVDHSRQLVRTAAVRERLHTQTVGPGPGRSYDVHLPLSRTDIITVASLLAV